MDSANINSFHCIPYRYGARCCCAKPDITATTVPAGRYARLVLATDGMWDVLNPHRVLQVMSHIREPLTAARKLTVAAYHRRIATKTKDDDISVIVVDINYNDRPANMKQMKSFCGCCLS